MPDLGDINWLAVVVAVVVAQVLGFLWYGPLFGKQWTAAVGRTEEEVRAEGPGAAIVVAVVASLFHAVALALILTTWDDVDLVSGIGAGLLASIGFAAISVVSNGMFEHRGKLLIGLYAGYLMLSITVMGAIIGAWN